MVKNIIHTLTQLSSLNASRLLKNRNITVCKSSICSLMHHACKTIQNYLNPDYCVTDGHYHTRIPGKLAPYEKEVIELRSKGLTYPQIHKILYEKGYTGSVASLRMSIYITFIRK